MDEIRMLRREVVATFALAAFVMSALYAFIATIALRYLDGLIGLEHIGAVFILGFWIVPAFSLMALAIATDVWRRDRVILDARTLVPLCALMPVLAAFTWLVAAAASGDFS
jgi:hypothetical protein